MPSHRRPRPRQPTFDLASEVKTMYFRSGKHTFENIKVPVVSCSSKPHQKYPVVDTILHASTRANSIHSTTIHLTDTNGKKQSFFVSYTFNPTARPNHMLNEICETSCWRGELLVMKCGRRDAVVNLLPQDRRIARIAICRVLEKAEECILQALHAARISFPHQLDHLIDPSL